MKHTAGHGSYPDEPISEARTPRRWVSFVATLALGSLACAPVPLVRSPSGEEEDAGTQSDARAGGATGGDAAGNERGSSAGGMEGKDAASSPDVAPAADASPAQTATPARDSAAVPDGSPAANLPPAAQGAKEVLFIVENSALVAGDASLKRRLELRGFTVIVQKDTETSAADAAGRKLVVVSRNALSSAVNTKFRDAAVPVICLHFNLFDDMALTGPTGGTDFGVTAGQTSISITDSDHPISAGLNGTVTVASAPGMLHWGVPGPGGKRVATVSGNATQSAMFVYPQGAMMAGGMAAPAHRVAWFASDGMAAQLTADGIKLFDAAVDWATGK